ncbi:MAG: hypothetical protein ACE15E_21555 [Acidobacteriota bacterium]
MFDRIRIGVVLFAVLLLMEEVVSGQDRQLLVSAQIAVGWMGNPGEPGSVQAITEVNFVNSDMNPASVVMDTYRDSGLPLVVKKTRPNGLASQGSSLTVNLTGFSSTQYVLSVCDDNWAGNCPSPDLRKGWAVLDIPRTMIVEVTYKILDYQGKVISAVGVAVQEPGNEFVFFGKSKNGSATAFAIANPNYTDTLVSVEVLDSNGNIVGQKDVPMKAKEQVAMFLQELFPAVANNLPAGQVRISSPTNKIAILVLGSHAGVTGPQLSGAAVHAVVR